MKQEKWITVLLCAVLVAGAGIFYLRSGQTAQKQQTGFVNSSTVVEKEADPSFSGEVLSGLPDGQEEESPQKECAVYICGAVKHPGVYHFTQMARICDVIEAAGGLKKNAAATSINQARYIVDGEQIQILTKKQKKKGQESGIPAGDVAGSAMGGGMPLVNINQASETELMTLSGIGQSKAKAIIDYRTQNGLFQTIEDIMNVVGIKEGVYNQIKDSITV